MIWLDGLAITSALRRAESIGPGERLEPGYARILAKRVRDLDSRVAELEAQLEKAYADIMLYQVGQAYDVGWEYGAQAGRLRGLEEAAREAERDFPPGDMGAAMRASYTAESIRALKPKAAPPPRVTPESRMELGAMQERSRAGLEWCKSASAELDAPRTFTLEEVERALDAIGADPGGGLLEDLRSVLTGGGE